MKKISKLLIVIGSINFLLFMYGFRSNESSALLISGIDSEEKLTGNNSGNCLAAYYGKPEELLTKDLVGKYVDFDGADVEIAKVSDQIIRDTDFAQVNCKWKIDRQRHIIRLKHISKIELYKSKTPVERFYDKYHIRTSKEQEEMKKLYDSLVISNVELKNKTDRSSADRLSESIGFDFQYLNIDDIGDAAVWEYKVNDLIVLVGEYQFSLNVNLNKGNDHDLEKAKLLAKAIIEKACK